MNIRTITSLVLSVYTYLSLYMVYNMLSRRLSPDTLSLSLSLCVSSFVYAVYDGSMCRLQLLFVLFRVVLLLEVSRVSRKL